MRRWMMVAVAALVLSACANSSEEQSEAASEESSEATTQTREERIAEIEELEQDLRSKQKQPFETVKPLAMQMVREYRDFVVVNPKDSLAPRYLFKAADLSVGLKKYDQAIGFLDNVLANYPAYERNVEMMLFKGFVFEQHMNQHGRAVEAYQALIDRYPNHRLANDARAAIENLTLTEEELIEKFKKMNEKEQPAG